MLLTVPETLRVDVKDGVCDVVGVFDSELELVLERLCDRDAVCVGVMERDDVSLGVCVRVPVGVGVDERELVRTWECVRVWLGLPEELGVIDWLPVPLSELDCDELELCVGETERLDDCVRVDDRVTRCERDCERLAVNVGVREQDGDNERVRDAGSVVDGEMEGEEDSEPVMLVLVEPEELELPEDVSVRELLADIEALCDSEGDVVDVCVDVVVGGMLELMEGD